MRLIALLLACMLSTYSGWSQADNLYADTDLRNEIGKDSTGENNPRNGIRKDSTGENDGRNEEEFDRDEVPITLNVPRIGSFEVSAFAAGRKVDLSVREVFDFLKIRNMPSGNGDSLTGFFISPEAPYCIDGHNNTITYGGKVYRLRSTALIVTPTALYLQSDYLGDIFGLDCSFDFRSLSVTLNSKIELPAIREMQLELMRRNISQLKGERKADTIIGRSFSMLKLGTAEWSVISTQEKGRPNNTRAWLGLGAALAGGELNLSLNYNSDDTLTMRQQLYQWRYVNNDHAALRQITAGKIFSQSISSIYAPVIGVQLTNTPTVFRRSYGSYTLSNTTQPNWIVELYVNNVLLSYTKADASGFYTFEVPMVYGNSLVKLRFYGPWGEEQISEKYISVPFNFTPLHQFEYNVIAGVVDNDSKGESLRAAVSYGLSRNITIGGGMEYLSTLTSAPSMPFVNLSLRLGSHTLVSAEHIRNVRSKAILNYRLPSELQVELGYTRYDRNQTAILTNFLEEKKLVASMPIKGKKFSAYTKLSLNQFTLAYNKGLTAAMSKYTSAEFLFSSIVAGVSSNLTTYAIISNPGNPLVYTNVALNFRTPKGGIRFTPQVQYEYRQKELSMLKLEVEKNLFNRGFLNLAFQKSFIHTLVDNYSTGITLGFRYNFSFTQVSSAVTKYKHTVSSTQAARGSLLYDSKTNYTSWSNQPALGRGGFIILPFLDLNCNGHKDANEPKAYGLKLHTSGGHTEYNTADTTIRITGLEAYANYYIELDKSSFDNVAWQIRNATISVTATANSFRLVEIPVSVVGEVSGTVQLQTEKGTNGLGRIIVNFYNEQGTVVAHTLTEPDGYFNYIGLAPGRYTAGADVAQLAKLGMTASETLPFTITKNLEGDMVNDLKFVLKAAK